MTEENIPKTETFWNSAEGMVTVQLYSWSGMPNCSESRSINFKDTSCDRSFSVENIQINLR